MEDDYEGRVSTSGSRKEFDIGPMRRECDYCGIEVVTYVEHEISPLFFMLAVLELIIFGWLSFIMIPLSYMLSKNAVHRCSRCL